MIRVDDANGNLLEDSSLAGAQDADIVINLNGNTAIVSGLGAGYRIEGVAGKFDIGAFSIGKDVPLPDQKLAFAVTITDGEGDTAVAGFNSGIDGNHDGLIF